MPLTGLLLTQLGFPVILNTLSSSLGTFATLFPQLGLFSLAHSTSPTYYQGQEQIQTFSGSQPALPLLAFHGPLTRALRCSHL